MDLILGSRAEWIERAFGAWRRLPRPVRRCLARAMAAQAARRAARLCGPVRVVFFVTHRCTRRCRFCLYHRHLGGPEAVAGELDLAEIETLARSLPERLGLLTITGGEPFLREDIPAIAGLFDRHNHSRKLSLITNGDLPDRAEDAVLEILRSTALSVDLQVSIQCPADLEPDQPAGQTLRRFVGVARQHPRVGVVTALTTIGRDNHEQLGELSRRLAGSWEVHHKFQLVRGIPDHVFPSPSGCLSNLSPPELSSLVLTAEQERALLTRMERAVEGTRYPLLSRAELVQLALTMEIAASGQAPFPCRAGHVECTIFEDGRVSVCENLAASAFLRDHGMDLGALWRSPEFGAARRSVVGCACTHPCNLSTAMLHHRVGMERLLG